MYPEALNTQKLAQPWARTVPIVGALDPFSFIHRVSLYKTLIDATNVDGYFGADNDANPLWGLVYQLEWQYSTGRLNISAAEDVIDPDSPWGFGNFTLSIIPYLGAIAAGLVDDVAILAPKTSSRFEYIRGPNQAERTVPQ